jgi:gamma-glutamylcyclotransferase (GGCT)/AIG2-like uncharacterized protein YtfP
MLNGNLSIFVYGTLKKGYCNHSFFLSEAKRIQKAFTWGRLFGLIQGFPALVTSSDLILTEGGFDLQADLEIKHETPSYPVEKPEGDWDQVYGELVELPRPYFHMKKLDRLEGFVHPGPCLYKRVIVPVISREKCTSAWTYVMEDVPEGKRVKGGVWLP